MTKKKYLSQIPIEKTFEIIELDLMTIKKCLEKDFIDLKLINKCLVLIDSSMDRVIGIIDKKNDAI